MFMSRCYFFSLFFFFFNDTPTTEIYTLSLHDALPISTRTIPGTGTRSTRRCWSICNAMAAASRAIALQIRSEEHTSELQSRPHLVCRLLLEKKKKKTDTPSRKRQHSENSSRLFL